MKEIKNREIWVGLTFYIYIGYRENEYIQILMVLILNFRSVERSVLSVLKIRSCRLHTLAQIDGVNKTRINILSACIHVSVIYLLFISHFIFFLSQIIAIALPNPMKTLLMCWSVSVHDSMTVIECSDNR